MEVDFEMYEAEEDTSSSSFNTGISKSHTSRKRKKGDLTTKQKVKEAKTKRYSAPTDSNLFESCPHSTKRFRCSQILPVDAKSLRDELYKVPDKTLQDIFVSRLVQINQVKRRRSRQLTDFRKHAYAVNYFINSDVNKKKIPVCKKLFLSVTNFGRARLANIVKKVSLGDVFTENRGGDRVGPKKGNLQSFIDATGGGATEIEAFPVLPFEGEILPDEGIY